MGYGIGFGSSVSKLYRYYSDIASYPKKYPRYCINIKIISKEKDVNTVIITTRERWKFSFKSKNNKCKTAIVQMTVCYKLRRIPKPLPYDHFRLGWNKAPISFEILEGNPGDVMPNVGSVTFARSSNVQYPTLIHADISLTGELALNHLNFIKGYKGDAKEIEKLWHEMVDYCTRQDYIHIHGKDIEKESQKYHRGIVKLKKFGKCLVSRYTWDYPWGRTR